MSNPDKSIDIYERLAAALEALPHGFPRTTSGVEIKLIKMAFTPGGGLACRPVDPHSPRPLPRSRNGSAWMRPR